MALYLCCRRRPASSLHSSFSSLSPCLLSFFFSLCLTNCSLWHSNNTLSCHNSRVKAHIGKHIHTHTQKKTCSSSARCPEGYVLTVLLRFGTTVSMLLLWCFVSEKVSRSWKDQFVIRASAWPGRPKAFLVHEAALIRSTNIAPVSGWLSFQLCTSFAKITTKRLEAAQLFWHPCSLVWRHEIRFDVWDVILQNVAGWQGR